MVSRAPEDLPPIPAEKAHDLGDFAEARQIMARIQEREEELSRELASILGTRRFDDGE